LGRIAVNEWAETWLASKKTLKGRTYTGYESVWRTLVKPHWGDTRLDRVAHGEVVRWVAELTERGLSPSRITEALLCLKTGTRSGSPGWSAGEECRRARQATEAAKG
jgi:Phage integrase, N-terminal SAM-like domain